MSKSSYIIVIDNKIVDYNIEDFSNTFVDYNLEDTLNFQTKQGSEAINIKLPATKNNLKVFNTANDLNIDAFYISGVKDINIECNGIEVFVGKCILKKVSLRGTRPLYIEISAFANNSEWILALKNYTLYDVVKNFPSHVNNFESVENSWHFPNAKDKYGRSLPYVLAPARYNNPVDMAYGLRNNELSGPEGSFSILNMKPSISIKYIIEEALKYVGYSVDSVFFNTHYFERMVMPWTWGEFLTTEGTKYDIHKFNAIAKEKIDFATRDGSKEDYLFATPNFTVDKNEKPGAFENNKGSFSSQTKDKDGKKVEEVSYKYLNNNNYGPLTFIFETDFDYQYHKSKLYEVNLHYYINGSSEIQETLFKYEGGHNSSFITNKKHNTYVTLNPGEKVTFWWSLKVRRADGNIMLLRYLDIKSFGIKAVLIPHNGEVLFDNFTVFQKYKVLDLIKGVIDLFNLNISTDPVSRTIKIEPAHPYKVSGVMFDGFYDPSETIDWTAKQDYSEESEIELFSNASRHYVMKFKESSGDVEVSKIKDMFNVTVGSAKYYFSERFKEEDKGFENRFFTPTIHCITDTYKINVVGEGEDKVYKKEYSYAQMVCIKTSDDANSKNTDCGPKIAYYKGITPYDNEYFVWRGGQSKVPFMFAVNYNDNTLKDPVLSYCDENIGGRVVVGLLKRFFLPKLSILDYGITFTTKMMLNYSDIADWYHNKRINIDGNAYEILSIKDFNLFNNTPATAVLRRWTPIVRVDSECVFPSKESILYGEPKKEEDETMPSRDMKYKRMMEFLNLKNAKE